MEKIIRVLILLLLRHTHTHTRKPLIYPEGVDHVLVNGVQVIEEGNHTDKLPGKILYSD
jgi:hypothetical protein